MDIKRSNVKDIIELNIIQKGMLFNALSEENNNLYTIQICIDIKGDLNINIFKNAVIEVQRINDALRSVFDWEKTDKPLQIILKEAELNFEFNHISELGVKDIEEFIEKDKQKSFDLKNEVPVRFNLVATQKDSYTLIITHHHILYDGWSTGIILKELFSTYFDLNKKKKVSSHKFDKGDYKNISAAILNGYNKKIALNNWNSYLEGYEIKLLRNASFKASNTINEIKQYSFTFPIEKINAFSKEHSVTKASIFFGAYGLVLQKYLNTNDIIFGTPISNRPLSIKNSANIIGNFINTIPLRCKTSSENTLLETIKEINKEIKDKSDFSHASISYSEVKKILNLVPGQNLFDSILAIENYPLDQKAINSNSEFKIRFRSSFENIESPLMVQVFFREKINISLLYHTEYFDQDFIVSFAAHLNNILSEIVLTPEKLCKDLTYLTRSEHDKLIYEFNKTEFNISKNETILDLFDYWVDRTPEAIAIRFQDEEITYIGLFEKSNDLAQLLISKGVKTEEMIPLCLYPSIEMIIGLIAIMRCGGAYIPIDPEYPKERIAYIMKDTRVKLVLSDSSLHSKFIEPANYNIVNLDELRFENNKVRVTTNIHTDQLAYVIYTSGTTGTPKGVMIEHFALYNFIKSMENILKVDERVKLLGVTSFTFDISILEFFLPICVGGQLLLTNNDQSKDPELLQQYIAKVRPTHIQTTPSRWKMLVDADWKNEEGSYILTGGEQLTEKIKSDLLKITVNPIWNMYGPTETTIWSCTKQITAEDKITIGKPIGNTQIYITDSHLNLVPIGVIGELCISGNGVSRGYLNREDLTNNKFLDNPFIASKRVYKTGDLARWLPNGEIEYLGRKDNQVKIRGYRIELSEIDYQLEKMEYVNKAITLVKENAVGGKQLISYVIMNSKLDTKVMTSGLKEMLPNYMVPKFFVEVNQFPLTVSGKIDRKKLSKIYTKVVTPDNYSHPKTVLEQKLIEILQELLGVKKIGVFDSFFELGGDSLTMMSFIMRLKKEFKLDIPFNKFFQYQNVDTLAKMIKISTSALQKAENIEGETIFL